jgi:aconitate hydratase
LDSGAKVIFPDIKKHIENGDTEIPIQVDGNLITALLEVSDRQRELLIAGGVLNLVKKELIGKR